ncbi:MAG: histidine kinase [Nostoc sp.]
MGIRGNGEWGAGEAREAEEAGGTRINAQCPMPNAQCPMPNAQFI